MSDACACGVVHQPEEMPSLIGFHRDRWHRYGLGGRYPLPSVTTICKVIGKEWLIGWAKREVARTAVERFGDLEDRLVRDGAADTIAWLASTPDVKRDAAADFGTRIHAHAEKLAYGVEPDDMTAEERPFVEAFLRWRAEYGFEEIEAEFGVVHLGLEYAGTGDLLGRLDGRIVMVDIKSGNRVPEDIELQLAGYSRADGIGRPGKAALDPLPHVQRHAVLHIRPEQHKAGYEFRYVPVTPRTFETFVHARHLFSWRQEKDRQWKLARKEAAA